MAVYICILATSIKEVSSDVSLMCVSVTVVASTNHINKVIKAQISLKCASVVTSTSPFIKENKSWYIFQVCISHRGSQF